MAVHMHPRFSRRQVLSMLGGAALGAGLVGLEADRVLSSGSGNNKSVATGPSNVPQYVPLQEAGTPGPSAAKEIRKEPNTLREWADSAGIEIGTDLGYLNIMSSLKAKEFNSAVLAYDMAWTNLEPEKGNTQYRNSSKSAYADQNINYAINKKMNLSGQSLIFTSEYPDWIKNGNFSEQEAIDIVKKHVNEVVAHYKGRVSRWVVVNEFHPVAWGRDDVLQRIVSPDLVDIAFQAAREADPDAKLIYNDNGNETPNSGATIITRSIAQRLSDKNLIDGIGVQMHVDGSNPPSREDIIRTMKGYGVPVYITEMDVNMKDVDVNNENRLKQQADVYKDIMQAALDSGVCESFCFWGIGDKYSWIETTKSYPFYSPNADPTPFDDNLQPKPAYYAILDVVKNAAHLRNG